MTELWFAAWRGCDCSDVQSDKTDIPALCPCHGGPLLGLSPISEGVTSNLGHLCEVVGV